MQIPPINSPSPSFPFPIGPNDQVYDLLQELEGDLAAMKNDPNFPNDADMWDERIGDLKDRLVNATYSSLQSALNSGKITKDQFDKDVAQLLGKDGSSDPFGDVGRVFQPLFDMFNNPANRTKAYLDTVIAKLDAVDGPIGQFYANYLDAIPPGR
ncbi:MAG: hypothetical protein ACHQT8_00250 [Chlamydiales bacterium]